MASVPTFITGPPTAKAGKDTRSHIFLWATTPCSNRAWLFPLSLVCMIPPTVSARIFQTISSSSQKVRRARCLAYPGAKSGAWSKFRVWLTLAFRLRLKYSARSALCEKLNGFLRRGDEILACHFCFRGDTRVHSLCCHAVAARREHAAVLRTISAIFLRSSPEH